MKRGPKPRTPEQKKLAEIRDAYERGDRLSLVAKHHHVSVARIGNLAREHGWKPPLRSRGEQAAAAEVFKQYDYNPLEHLIEQAHEIETEIAEIDEMLEYDLPKFLQGKTRLRNTSSPEGLKAKRFLLARDLAELNLKLMEWLYPKLKSLDVKGKGPQGSIPVSFILPDNERD